MSLKTLTFLTATAGLACVLGFGCSSGGSSGGPAFSLPSAAGGKDAGKTDSAKADSSAADGGLAGDASATDGMGGENAGADGLADAKAAADTGPVNPLAGGDGDGDGFGAKGGDCDDGDPAVHPGAKEKCNGVDDDCNEKIDDFDHDGDGFSPCPGEKPDCNDTDAKIFPGAKTSCTNGKDNDCNGAIDAQEDNDADGFLVCDDCNDDNADIFPGAAKNCKNGKDNDCDGEPDGKLDADGDGAPACNDCDDKDPKVFPGAPDVCDKKDNDCNGLVDDKDGDGDGYSGCLDDCNDAEITINPSAAVNCKNGKDNNCNGKIDAQEDADGDGFVGCADCNDSNKLVNPNAVEMATDLIDNDCDGAIDEIPAPCDKPGLNAGNVNDYPSAIDVCVGVQKSEFPVLASPNARAIHQSFGPANLPVKGPNFVVMSSGNAAAPGHPNYVLPQSGTSFTNEVPFPPVKCQNSGKVYDFTEWKLTLKVPSNAKAFSFDFNFMSSEYPEYVGTQFNDKFVAVLDSKAFKGNVSFDSGGNCISINNALFQVCDKPTCKEGAGALKGTGYENGVGGGTGWLTTTSPVTAGEIITLRFMIFDEGDHILDSVVLIDDFRWHTNAKSGGPSTVRPGGG